MPNAQGGIGRTVCYQIANAAGSSALIDIFSSNMGGAVFNADDTARIYTAGFQKFDDETTLEENGGPTYYHSVDCTAGENVGLTNNADC